MEPRRAPEGRAARARGRRRRRPPDRRQRGAGRSRSRDDVLDDVLIALAAERPRADRGLPGRGQDRAGAGARALDRRRLRAHPVHGRPAARRRGRRQRSTTSASSASSSGPGRSSPTSCSSTRSTAPRPRRSPACSSACRSGGSRSTSTRHELARPVPRPGHAEPDRVRGHLPAARGAGRPLHGAACRSATRTPPPRPGCWPTHETGDRVLDLETVADAAEVLDLQDAAARVRASRALREYIVSLLGHTRADPRVELGASPRAGLMLLRAAKARALLEGRDHALPDDVQALAQPVLAHRIVLAPEAAEASGGAVVADADLADVGVVAVRGAVSHRSAGRRLHRRRGAARRRAVLRPRRDLHPARRGLRRLGRGGRARRAYRRTISARRVVEDEPPGARVVVSHRRAALPVPARSTSRCWTRRCRCRPGASASPSASTRAFARRGRRTLAPPRAVVRDPIGLSVREAAVGEADEVLVLPRTEPVLTPGAGPEGERAGDRPLLGRGGRDRGRRPAPLPRGHAGVAHPLAGARAPARPARAPPAARGRRRPLVVLDTARPTARRAVRRRGPRGGFAGAAPGARDGGCALLLPGDRRPTGSRPRPRGWPDPARATRAGRLTHRPPALTGCGPTPVRPHRLYVAASTAPGHGAQRAEHVPTGLRASGAGQPGAAPVRSATR